MNGNEAWLALADSFEWAETNARQGNTSAFEITNYLATLHRLASRVVIDHSQLGNLPDEQLLADARKIRAFCADAGELLHKSEEDHITFLARLEGLDNLCESCDERCVLLLDERDEPMAA